MPSLSGWTEGILLSVLIVILFGGVIVGFNTMYNKDNQIGLGTNTSQSEFSEYQGTLADQIQSGEADFTSSEGLTLKSSWNIIESASSIIWNFFTGGWIETILTDYMKLPSIVATIFRILFFLSMGFIILKILFKVKP